MVEIAVTNFRTFRERTVIPFAAESASPDAIAVLHGENGAGKSNALAALDMFFQAVTLVLHTLRTTPAAEVLRPWDTGLAFGAERPVAFPYRDRPYGAAGPMEIDVAFADERLGRLRVTCTPSGEQVRVQLGRVAGNQGAFTPVVPEEADQLATWLLTPGGPGTRPLTVLDARRRQQWAQPREEQRSLLPPELAEALFALRTSRRPEHRELWRVFVDLVHRFETLRGKEVTMERPDPRVPARTELVVEERGRAVLGLDELSSGEQQVVVLVAAGLLAGSSILAIQEPEISLDARGQRLFRAILDDMVARGLFDQAILESHVPTFDGGEVIRFARRPDGTTEVTRARSASAERRAIAAKAKAQGAEQRWITRDGYTQIPDVMRDDLRLVDGGHVWFLKGPKHWEAWPEAEVDELFGLAGEGDD
jgi:energy-coupling factor transporter ATP-binding protein EcfA2